MHSHTFIYICCTGLFLVPPSLTLIYCLFVFCSLLCYKSTGLAAVLYKAPHDKVSMLTHTYPHNPMREIKVTICDHQADSPLYVWPHV